MDYTDFVTRVREGANSVYHLQNLSKWITKHTKLGGKLFSYKGHEYQPVIIDNPAKTLYVVKCAQTGLSEIFARWAMAAMTTQSDFTLMWTFPSSTDAENFTKARLDPLIAGSTEISRAISKVVNSVSLKQFGMDNFAYIRGTKSDTGGLSVPADLLIHDEYDKSDMDNISTYLSRLQHKPTKMRRIFSTPTVSKYGISGLADASRRWREMWKCSHCNHRFLPSYEENIIIPGWDGEKKLIDKTNIKDIRWQEAVLLCPKCGKAPDSSVRFREWVVENIQDSYEEETYFVSPFSAPTYITPPYIVSTQAKMDKWAEFCNQVLGLVAEDDDDTLTEKDIRDSFVTADLNSSEVHYLGADMGLMCNIAIGRRTQAGELLVVHRERVAFNKFAERRRELCAKYRVVTSVHDVYPYTDIIKTITDFDPNAYGALYVEKASTELYTVREGEPEEEEGKLNVRLVNINRTVSLDHLMHEFKRKKVVLPDGDDKELVVTQLRDMKRVQQMDKYGGLVYRWVKITGNDHYHHALVYLQTACSLRGTANFTLDMSNIGIIRTVKAKNW